MPQVAKKKKIKIKSKQAHSQCFPDENPYLPTLHTGTS